MTERAPVGNPPIKSVLASREGTPALSWRRTVEPRKRKCTGSPTTRPNCASIATSVPSSMPKGATHSAWIGASKPGTAGIEDSIAT